MTMLTYKMYILNKKYNTKIYKKMYKINKKYNTKIYKKMYKINIKCNIKKIIPIGYTIIFRATVA